jgi:hypothetical protein
VQAITARRAYCQCLLTQQLRQTSSSLPSSSLPRRSSLQLEQVDSTCTLSAHAADLPRFWQRLAELELAWRIYVCCMLNSRMCWLPARSLRQAYQGCRCFGIEGSPTLEVPSVPCCRCGHPSRAAAGLANQQADKGRAQCLVGALGRAAGAASQEHTIGGPAAAGAGRRGRAAQQLLNLTNNQVVQLAKCLGYDSGVDISTVRGHMERQAGRQLDKQQRRRQKQQEQQEQQAQQHPASQAASSSNGSTAHQRSSTDGLGSGAKGVFAVFDMCHFYSDRDLGLPKAARVEYVLGMLASDRLVDILINTSIISSYTGALLLRNSDEGKRALREQNGLLAVTVGKHVRGWCRPGVVLPVVCAMGGALRPGFSHHAFVCHAV